MTTITNQTQTTAPPAPPPLTQWRPDGIRVWKPITGSKVPNPTRKASWTPIEMLDICDSRYDMFYQGFHAAPGEKCPSSYGEEMLAYHCGRALRKVHDAMKVTGNRNTTTTTTTVVTNRPQLPAASHAGTTSS